jgi:hypothetical protein
MEMIKKCVVVDVVAVQTMMKKNRPKRLLWFLANIATHFLLNLQRFVPTVVQEEHRKYKNYNYHKECRRFLSEKS